MTSTLLTLEMLRKNPRDLNYPLRVILPGDEILLLTRALRVIINKRITAEAIWQDKPVLVKLFFHPSKALYYANRDSDGSQMLVESGLKTPHLYYMGQAVEPSVSLLIYEYLQDSIPFRALWKAADTFTQLPLSHQLIALIAKQHEKGILQSDAHLDNFLSYQDQLYSLDGDGIRKSRLAKVSLKEGIKNLALFLADMHLIHPLHPSAQVKYYLQLREETIKPSHRKWIDKCFNQALFNLRRERLGKTLRECSHFVVEKKICQTMTFPRRYKVNLTKLAQHWPQAKLKSSVLPALPFRQAVWDSPQGQEKGLILALPALPWVKEGGRCHFVLPKNYADKLWQSAHHLLLIRIPTLVPFCYIERGAGPITLERHIVFKPLTDPESLPTYLARYLDDPSQLESLFSEMVAILGHLIQHQTICSPSFGLGQWLQSKEGLRLLPAADLKFYPQFERFVLPMRNYIKALIQQLGLYPQVKAVAEQVFARSSYIDAILQ